MLSALCWMSPRTRDIASSPHRAARVAAETRVVIVVVLMVAAVTVSCDFPNNQLTRKK
jgi:hypothetical protein